MIKIPALLFLCLLAACKVKTNTTCSEIARFPYGKYTISYGGCGGSAMTEFTRAGDNLYKDSRNNLYFLAYDRSDEAGEARPVFILRFSNDCEGDSSDAIYDIGKTIDIASFKSLGDGYYRDAHHKYHHTSMADGGHLMIVQNDRETYIPQGKGFYLGADGKMYIETAEVLDGGKGEGSGPSFFREVPMVDVNRFKHLGQEEWYAKDSTNVYIDHFMTDGRHIWVLEDADAASFQSIGYRWGKDKSHVFENGILLEGLHPDSLIILCPETTEYKQVFFEMVKDNDQVFCGNQEMRGVDAPSFECVASDAEFAYRDKNWNYKKNYFPNRNESDRVKR